MNFEDVSIDNSSVRLQNETRSGYLISCARKRDSYLCRPCFSDTKKEI